MGAASCLISGGESGGAVDFSGWISGSCSAGGILGFGARGGLDLGRRLLSRVSLDEEVTEDGGEEGGLGEEGGTEVRPRSFSGVSLDEEVMEVGGEEGGLDPGRWSSSGASSDEEEV